MTSSCTLGFQATRPATWAHFIHPLFIYCTLVNRKVFLGQITAGCKHNTARLDKWLEILAVEGLARKNGDLNFSESSKEEDQSVNRAAS